ncbi:TylF/MycF family methyltransferase [Candidatus Pelagibacter sp.]|nr:TylF/MycF family methyltransferase [Candidatus Pelagibacter sp.]
MFEKSKCPTDKKLKNFSKYVKRQHIARFMAQYEIFKRQLNIMGSIVECGVHHGGGVMAWAKISSILEPYNYKKKIIGFDTFKGFPSVSKIDNSKEGMFAEDYNTYEELLKCIEEYNNNRFLNNIDKIELVKGDANLTIPKYIKKNKHLLVSLLYLDFDIYKPTKTALKNFLPRMSKGSIIAFDELHAENWKGETMAMLESLDIRDCKIENFSFEPNISFIQL